MKKRGYRIDLHTHSYGSPDGGLTADQYGEMLTRGGMALVAITDHGTIRTAQKIRYELLSRAPHMLSRIIIGQEVMTDDGEIIGLGLTRQIPDGTSLRTAVEAIRRQKALVYVPHPFETVRHGLHEAALDSVAGMVDIVEIYNGRAIFQNRSAAAKAWAEKHNVAMAASSDAHGWIGWGRTYTTVSARPDQGSLVSLLKHGAAYTPQSVGVGVLYPKLNRLRKRLRTGGGKP